MKIEKQVENLLDNKLFAKLKNEIESKIYEEEDEEKFTKLNDRIIEIEEKLLSEDLFEDVDSEDILEIIKLLKFVCELIEKYVGEFDEIEEFVEELIEIESDYE